MAGALLMLSANYSVHLLIAPRFLWQEAAIMMNLATYSFTYWLFSCAFIVLLNRYYLTWKRFLTHLLVSLLYAAFSFIILFCVPAGTVQHTCMAAMAHN